MGSNLLGDLNLNRLGVTREQLTAWEGLCARGKLSDEEMQYGPKHYYDSLNARTAPALEQAEISRPQVPACVSTTESSSSRVQREFTYQQVLDLPETQQLIRFLMEHYAFLVVKPNAFVCSELYTDPSYVFSLILSERGFELIEEQISLAYIDYENVYKGKLPLSHTQRTCSGSGVDWEEVAQVIRKCAKDLESLDPELQYITRASLSVDHLSSFDRAGYYIDPSAYTSAEMAQHGFSLASRIMRALGCN